MSNCSKTNVMTLAPILVVLAMAGSAEAAIQDGLISHYKFDEASGASAALDAQGRINGDLTQDDNSVPPFPIPTSGATGKIGNAWDYERDNQEFLDEGGVIFANAAAATVSGWVNPESLDAGEFYTIFSEEQSTKTTNKDAFFQIIDGGKLSLGLELGGASHDIVTTDSVLIMTGQWSHVAFTFTNDGIDAIVKLYVNGQVEKTAAVTPNNIDALNELMVGVIEDSDGSETFDGLIDDLGFWERALSDDEIQGIFNSGNDGKDISQAVVPEPSSLGLALGTGVMLLVRRRRWQA